MPKANPKTRSQFLPLPFRFLEKMVTPITIRKARARILRAACLRMKSPMGFAKKRITTKERMTAMMMTQRLLVRPTPVITESRASRPE